MVVDTENTNPLNIPSSTKSRRSVVSQDERKPTFKFSRDTAEIENNRYNSN